MKPRNKYDFNQEALENISEVIRKDILPLLVQANITQVTIENPIQDVFGTGLNINITTNIKVEPVSEYEFRQKEKQTRKQNKHKFRNIPGMH